MLVSFVNGACPRLLAGHVALGSEASIKRIVLCPRDRLFNKGKIVVKGLSQLAHEQPWLLRDLPCHDHFCGHIGARHIGNVLSGGHRFGSFPSFHD
jgi:hypothetical protein